MVRVGTGASAAGSAALVAQLIVAGGRDGVVRSSSGGSDRRDAVEEPMSFAAPWTTNDAAERREHS